MRINVTLEIPEDTVIIAEFAGDNVEEVATAIEVFVNRIKKIFEYIEE